jgi:hypothetical protein
MYTHKYVDKYRYVLEYIRRHAGMQAYACTAKYQNVRVNALHACMYVHTYVYIEREREREEERGRERKSKQHFFTAASRRPRRHMTWLSPICISACAIL